MKRPVDVALDLAVHYGHKLDRPVMYTQGVALNGRLRLHELLPESPSPVEEITGIVAQYAADLPGIFGPDDGTANYAGLCWADGFAVSAGDESYLDLVRFAADKFGPTLEEGPLDPDIRVEDFFFAATILGRAFRATDESAYIDLLAEFLLSSSGTLQPDGLWWHCKLSPYYWGRGNGFAALGFAEALTYLPDDNPSRPELLQTHIRHLNGLLKHQDASGMWRQVVDMPETYLEHSATSMIGYAITKGLRRGWLDDGTGTGAGQDGWRQVLDRAWDGASRRIGDDGSIEHVCGGTGPQPDLESYVNRPYSDGLDDRGGAMALWFAVEMARLTAGE